MTSAFAIRVLRRRLASLATTPGSTLRVSGVSATLTVRANMETYVADVEAASTDGTPAETESWVTTDDAGNLTVVAAASGGATTISIPASFNVTIDMAGKCDVDLPSWLEGTVDVAVGEGNVVVNTVRGLLTSVRTGRGDVRVEHVEGNLAVTTDGCVDLGKIMGEDVRVSATGAVRSKALYGKALSVAAGGGMETSVLSTDDGQLSLGGDSSLDSLQGELSVEATAGNLSLQASDALRSLRVVHHQSGEGGVEGGQLPPGQAGAARPTVAVHVPEALRLQGRLAGTAVDVDERVGEPAASAAASDGSSAAVVVELGSDDGSKGARACEVSVEACGCHVTIEQRSWVEMMMMAKAEGRGRRHDGRAR